MHSISKQLVAFLVFITPACFISADDTDIYFKTGSTAGGAPLVMLSLDYRPNLGNTLCTSGPDCESQLGTEITKFITVPAGDTVTTFDALRAVYASVFEELDGVAVGMMINHDNNCNGKNASGPSQTGCSNGGYILSGFNEFVTGDTNGAKANLLAKMYALPVPQGNVSHSFQGKELYFEFFRYLTGGDVYNGHLGYKDFGDTSSSDNLDVDFPGASWDTSIEDPTGTSYIYPLTNVDSCSKLTAVNLLFQVANQEDESDNAIKATPPASLPGNGGIGLSGNKITYPDVIRAMNQFNFSTDINADQGLISYFISTNTNTTTNGYADAGGTSTAIDWADDAEGLQKLRETLGQIFREVLAVSGTFVSAAVPVNVFNRAEIDNNVFIALFSVDDIGKPLWPGNLKKLRLSETVDPIDGTSSFDLVDVNGNSAIDPTSGRIRYSALTYWTDPSTLPAPPTNPVGEDAFMEAGKDGRFVERGGAGQNVPGFVLGDGSPGTLNLTNASGDRQIFTEASTGTSLIDMDVPGSTTSVTADMIATLGATGDVLTGETAEEEVIKLLTWARGNDPDTGVARDWLLPDILHSKPVPINYGARGSYTATNPDIRVLMGTNDGFMHLFENTTAGGSQSGVENWAFVPRESLANIKRLEENVAGLPPHPYGTDGAATVYMDDQNGNNTIDGSDRVWAFFGMRRGGNNIYAMDLSDPDNPSLMWKIGKNLGVFSEMGLTFSQPTLINIQHGTSSKPALIFGGGYHGGWNSTFTARVGKDAGSSTDTEGNSIFIVDAETGALIWKAVKGASISRSALAFTHTDLVDSIPSAISVLDSNGDGLDDRAYVGDSGGSLWRIDFPASTSDNRAADWQVMKLATLDETGADRRFFHKPDIVQAERDGTYFDGVLLGSGDRADPTDTSVPNQFVLVKDSYTNTVPPVSTAPVTVSDLGDITNTCLTEGGACTADLSKGWKLDLEVSGEKVLSSPITIFGTVYFTTYIPAGSSLTTCEPNEGTGRIYAVSLFDGSPVFNRKILDDGGNDKPSTKDDRHETLASSGIPSDVVALTPTHILRPDLKTEGTGASKYWKTFWYEKGVD